MRRFCRACAMMGAVGVLCLLVYVARNPTIYTSRVEPNKLPTGVRALPPLVLWQHANKMAKAFDNADIMEVYWVDGPGAPPVLDQKIGEIGKAHDPQRWKEMTDAVASASRGDVAEGIWSLVFVLRKDGREIALGYCYPGDGELAMRIKGKDYGRVWAGEVFQQTLRPFEEQQLAKLRFEKQKRMFGKHAQRFPAHRK